MMKYVHRLKYDSFLIPHNFLIMYWSRITNIYLGDRVEIYLYSLKFSESVSLLKNRIN